MTGHATAPREKARHIHDDALEYSSTHLSIPVQEPRITLRSIGAVAASCLAYFSNQYAINSIGVHLWAIGVALRDTTNVVWLISAACLVSAAVGPIIAYYASVKLRKWIILGGLAFGIAGEVIAGVAKEMHIVIAGQALVGMALAVQPLLVTIPAEVLAQDKRKYAQVATNLAGGLGGFSGALGAGALLKWRMQPGDRDSLQWIFWIGAGLYGATLILLAVTYQPRHLQVCVNVHQAKPRFDWTGLVLLTFGLVPLMMGLTFGGQPLPWSRIQVLIPLIVGVMSLLLFGIWEAFGTLTGLFHHQMFRRGRNFPITLILFFIEGILSVVFLVWYNQEVYAIYQPDPFFQGLRFTVFYTAIILLAPLIAAYCSRTKSVKGALTLGNVLAVVAAVLMATINLRGGKATIGYAALAGVGLAAPLVILMTTAHLCAPPDLIHAVAPLATMVRTAGIVTGNVLAYLVVNTRINATLPRRVSTALQPLGVTGDRVSDIVQTLLSGDPRSRSALEEMTSLSAQTLDSAIQASSEARLEAFRFVWIVAAALAGLAVMGCLWMSPVGKQSATGSRAISLDTRSYTISTPRHSISLQGHMEKEPPAESPYIHRTEY